jgi:hypothetical protein
MAKYLIDGATLTAIADMIRTYIVGEMGYEIPETLTPEQMPGYIIEVADSNWDSGYEGGRSPFANLPEPLVIQAKNTPYYDSNTDDYYFDPYYTEDDSLYGGNCVGDYFDYETLTDSDKCQFTVYNPTDRYLKVCCYASVTASYGNVVEEFYEGITIAPDSMGNITFTSNYIAYTNADWDYTTIEGARFI